MSTPAAYVGEAPVPVIAPHGRVQRTYWQAARRRLLRDPVSMGCLLILFLIIAAAVFAPWITPHEPYTSSIVNRLKPVLSPGFVLGTDELGRDMLTRLIYGGRISLLMGLLPILIATLAGSVLGVVAGYVGGKTNMVIMRVADVFFAFPSVLLAVGLAGALGAGVVQVNLVIDIILASLLPQGSVSFLFYADLSEWSRMLLGQAQDDTFSQWNVLPDVLGRLALGGTIDDGYVRSPRS